MRDCAEAICAVARELAALGWSPATSGNYSVRLNDGLAAITVSGRDKGRLAAADIMVVDLQGRPVDGGTPSAETLLHTQLYARDPGCGAVLHVHSPHATLASRLFADEGAIIFRGYELLKAFAGQSTHESELRLPIVPNRQDIPALARDVEALLAAGEPLWGYLIASHGLYTWGRDLAEARRHLDAIDFLLGCELQWQRSRP